MPNVFTIPTYETERLILRAPTQADFEHMAHFFSDPVSAFYGGPCDPKTHGANMRCTLAIGL
jgi:RimJ/RimL family protein N-acetyltransferase